MNGGLNESINQKRERGRERRRERERERERDIWGERERYRVRKKKNTDKCIFYSKFRLESNPQYQFSLHTLHSIGTKALSWIHILRRECFKKQELIDIKYFTLIWKCFTFYIVYLASFFSTHEQFFSCKVSSVSRLRDSILQRPTEIRKRGWGFHII